MKIRLVLSIVATAVALAIAAPPQPGFADSTTPTTAAKSSLAYKKHHAATKHSPAYPGMERYRSSGFVGEFPGSCAYDRAAGNCVIDLGYGRCVDCSSGPFN
jgi:hypothetical protein